MSGTCKEWFDSIGCKSTLGKEQYTHLVWCAALASEVENFTDNQQRKDKIFRPCGCVVCEHNFIHECTLPECDVSERKTSSVA